MRSYSVSQLSFIPTENSNKKVIFDTVIHDRDLTPQHEFNLVPLQTVLAGSLESSGDTTIKSVKLSHKFENKLASSKRR